MLAALLCNLGLPPIPPPPEPLPERFDVYGLSDMPQVPLRFRERRKKKRPELDTIRLTAARDLLDL